MSRLRRLWSKIEGRNRANCDSSNQQFSHGTFLFGSRCDSYLTAYSIQPCQTYCPVVAWVWLRLSRTTPQRPYTSAPCRLALHRGCRSLSRNCIGNEASPDRAQTLHSAADEPLAVVVDLDQTAMAVGTVLTYQVWNHSDDNGQARSPGHWQCSEPHPFSLFSPPPPFFFFFFFFCT